MCSQFLQLPPRTLDLFLAFRISLLTVSLLFLQYNKSVSNFLMPLSVFIYISDCLHWCKHVFIFWFLKISSAVLKLPAGENRPLPYVLTLVPPLILSLLDPEIFFKALDFAGTYGGMYTRFIITAFFSVLCTMSLVTRNTATEMCSTMKLKISTQVTFKWSWSLLWFTTYLRLNYGCMYSIGAIWGSSCCNVLVRQIFAIIGISEDAGAGSGRKTHPLACRRRCSPRHSQRNSW